MIKMLKNVKGLFEIIDKSNLKFWSLDEIIQFRNDLLEIQKILKSVNAKGFVNELDLCNYPFFDGLVNRYILYKSDDDSSKNLSEEELILLKSRSLTSNENLVVSLWLNNMIYLNLYSLTIDLLSVVTVEAEEEEEDGCDINKELNDLKGDVLSDIEKLSKDFLGSIRGPIRESMRQRGVTMEENVYVGFDTEYKSSGLNNNRNEILSAQWAVNTKILLKIPIIEEYKMSGMNTQTGIIYPINSIWYKSQKINFRLMEQDINRFINIVRSYKFSNNDRSLIMLVNGLINKGLPYIEKNGYIIFSFPRTAIKTFIKTKDFGDLDFSSVINIAANISREDLEKSKIKVLDLLKLIFKEWRSKKETFSEISFRVRNQNQNMDNLDNVNNLGELRLLDDDDLMQKPLTGVLNKKYSRSSMSSFTVDKIAFTMLKNMYLVSHLTPADLSMLKDFDIIKKNFDIVNKSFVTIRKGLLIQGYNVHIRDTMLLAPGGKKSLASIGGMYDTKYNKLNLEIHEIENMDLLKLKNYNKFVDYAIKDSVITLIHACHMEDFNFRIGSLGVPLTLSGLSSNYLRSYWTKNDYRGYQISPDYLLGDTSKSITPKGLFSNGNVGLVLSLYIANYKGGRNESFMYGIDKSTKWFDYDLISAYTTAMSLLGNPDYNRMVQLNQGELELISTKDLIYSYTIIKGSFNFPLEVKYPSIACYIDETATVYPRSGTCCLTGPEYIAARNAGCEFKVTECYSIPFETEKDEFGVELLDKEGNVNFVNHPFKNVIKDLLDNRVQHAKGSINNLMYKELGNSLYGLVVRGINNKMKFDVKSNKTIRMTGNDISNPILASWITGYVRSLLGELLNELDKLNGKVVSVTTDGFITDVIDLESKLLNLDQDRVPLLREYRTSRKNLSVNNDSTALEVKHEGLGLISWTVRGQFSKDASIKATTGFQMRNLVSSELEDLLLKGMRSSEKSIDYVHFSLRSASEIYKKGGHVVSKYRDQTFRCNYDNRRLIDDKGLPSILDQDILYDGKPLNNIKEALFLRQMSNLSKNKVYQKNTSLKGSNGYKSKLEIGVRNFIRDLLNENNEVNLNKDVFNGYQGIIDYIKSFEELSGLKVNRKIQKSYISMVKSGSNSLKTIKRVPKTLENLEFVKFIKMKFPNFDDSNWFEK